MIENIKVLSGVCSILGSIILAYRVTGILKALSLVADVHEVNIHQLIHSPNEIIHFGNSTEHVENAKKISLLIIGFLFLISSGILQVLALFLSNQ